MGNVEAVPHVHVNVYFMLNPSYKVALEELAAEFLVDGLDSINLACAAKYAKLKRI